jgi:translation elongation factor EF-G
VKYALGVNKILRVLEHFETTVRRMADSFRAELGAVEKAEEKLLEIEQKEIAISEEERGYMRKDILGELVRLKKAEEKFNQITGAVRKFWEKTIKLAADLKAEKELYQKYLYGKPGEKGNIKMLVDETGIKRIEADVDYIISEILPSGKIVRKNIYLINVAIATLNVHVRGLKSGLEFVTAEGVA